MMAIIKCKMCGGDLSVTEGSVAVCEYCGTRQTVPTADSEKELTLFSRANRLRAAGEFDKAAGVYESIVADFPTEAEAYWGLVLCRYGIEYVDDPVTGQKIPTCHRSSFESVLEDRDFEQACENADVVARKVYREEAKAIEELRKGILEVSGKEEPYDIFICYKETDENGERTLDSVLAQDVYNALTEKGYRVFFSRVSLEDKLGTEYEPYIFAALNSAKIMLAFGTDYEHFNAVWVKNEWSRFLSLIAEGKKKTLIPCYKGIDAYDMPKEFTKLQAQDMGKVGAMQDLLRGVEKLLGSGKKPAAENDAAASRTSATSPEWNLLKRGELFLSDSNWRQAVEYFDKALDINAECADAYIGSLCAMARASSLQTLGEMYAYIQGSEAEKHVDDNEGTWDALQLLDEQPDYQKAVRYGTPEIQAALKEQSNIARRELEEHFLMLKKGRETACGELGERVTKIEGTLEELKSRVNTQKEEIAANEDRKKEEIARNGKRIGIAFYGTIAIEILIFFFGFDLSLTLGVGAVAFVVICILAMISSSTRKTIEESYFISQGRRREELNSLETKLYNMETEYKTLDAALNQEQSRLAILERLLFKVQSGEGSSVAQEADHSAQQAICLADCGLDV